MNSFSLAARNGGMEYRGRKTHLRPKSTVQGLEEKWMFHFKTQHTFKITKLPGGGGGCTEQERGDTCWFYINLLLSVRPQNPASGAPKGCGAKNPKTESFYFIERKKFSFSGKRAGTTSVTSGSFQCRRFQNHHSPTMRGFGNEKKPEIPLFQNAGL